MIGYAHSNWIRINQSSTTTSSSQKKGTVTGLDPNGDGFLAVRSEPKGRKLGELHNGDTVAILGQRGAWYKVRTSGGLVGWSHGDWVRADNINTHAVNPKNIGQETSNTIESDSIKKLRNSFCDAGDADACVSLGVLYDEGRDDYITNDYKALQYYKKACKLNSSKGCAYAGLMYANGEGVSKDLNIALNYLEKGCNKGYSKACKNAGKVRDAISNAFRGSSKNNCYRIKEYGPQRVCLNGTGGDACYGLKDYSMQRVCKNGARGDACYGLKDYSMQRVCKEGIRTSACYGLKNYNKQRSCQNFSGSTEFWLILAHYGYYTN